MVMAISDLNNVTAIVYGEPSFTFFTVGWRTFPMNTIFCRAVTAVGVAIVQN